MVDNTLLKDRMSIDESDESISDCMLCDHSGRSGPDTTESLARVVNTPKAAGLL